ncbi:MAG: MJ0042-type zinc finger domain-containing protein [Pseudolabrys sp.]
MLIVCPNCATSYMIDQAAVGQAGRTVRCARCQTTWHAGGAKAAPDVTAFVDNVIAEAEAQSPAPARAKAPPPPAAPAPAPQTEPMQDSGDDFGAEPTESITATGGMTTPVAPPALAVATPAEALVSEPEPAVIDDAPPLVPPIGHEMPSDTDSAALDPEEVESFAARRQRLQTRRKTTRRSSRWTAVILVLVAFNVALVGARKDVVRYLPQTASLFEAIGMPVNLRHLKFENVRISKEAQDGVNILIVDGAIVSEADKPVTVPRLRFAARNATGQEVYTWTELPTRSILGPGERLQFHSEIPAPPADASDVMVRFFTARDAGAK